MLLRPHIAGVPRQPVESAARESGVLLRVWKSETVSGLTFASWTRCLQLPVASYAPDGKPAFVVIPFDEYRKTRAAERNFIPHKVVSPLRTAPAVACLAQAPEADPGRGGCPHKYFEVVLRHARG